MAIERRVFAHAGPHAGPANLLDHYGVRLVAYPSAGPETFSFTLSEAWAASPRVVPPIGALVDRVSTTGAPDGSLPTKNGEATSAC